MSQDRAVAVQAFAAQATPEQVSQTITAPDAGPFSASPSIQNAGTSSFATASGSQTSSIAADRITGIGGTDAYANAPFDPSAW